MTTTPTQETLPAKLTHCINVYSKMRESAEEFHEGSVPIVVWEGYFTGLMRDLKLAVPYYTMVKNLLVDMGCIKQLRRGGGNATSQWELLRPPTPELWATLPDDTTGATRTPANESSFKILQQHVAELTKRLENLERNIEVLVDLFNKQQPKKGA
jgi:hypothetical protein